MSVGPCWSVGASLPATCHRDRDIWKNVPQMLREPIYTCKVCLQKPKNHEIKNAVAHDMQTPLSFFLKTGYIAVKDIFGSQERHNMGPLIPPLLLAFFTYLIEFLLPYFFFLPSFAYFSLFFTFCHFTFYI